MTLTTQLNVIDNPLFEKYEQLSNDSSQTADDEQHSVVAAGVGDPATDFANVYAKCWPMRMLSAINWVLLLALFVGFAVSDSLSFWWAGFQGSTVFNSGQLSIITGIPLSLATLVKLFYWCANKKTDKSNVALARIMFSEKSDIWAFGVLIWECFSRGALPYGGATEFWTVLCRLRDDQDSVVWRLARPKHCPPVLYDQLMLRCWRRAPEERPTFAHAQTLLDELFAALIVQCPDIGCEEVTFEDGK